MNQPTHELSRTVRFCVHTHGPGADAAMDAPRHNTFAAWPSMRGTGAFYELRVTCRGVPNPETGYMMSISIIDDHVRRVAIPIIERAFRTQPETAPPTILAGVYQALETSMDAPIHSIRWHLTPYYAVTMMNAASDRVVMTQQFEFAASHRLHCPSLSEEENRAVFGRCNNVSGHGHNYRIEPAVSMPIEGDGAMNLLTLEQLVDEHIIQRFDHKHLNLDTEEFASLNPSVEHIAKVCYERLTEPVAAHGGRLERITVWETEKTSCTYPAPRE